MRLLSSPDPLFKRCINSVNFEVFMPSRWCFVFKHTASNYCRPCWLSALVRTCSPHPAPRPSCVPFTHLCFLWKLNHPQADCFSFHVKILFEINSFWYELCHFFLYHALCLFCDQRPNSEKEVWKFDVRLYLFCKAMHAGHVRSVFISFSSILWTCVSWFIIPWQLQLHCSA